MRKSLLLTLLAALPLVLHFHMIDFPPEVLARFPGISPQQPDVFNWWKNAVLYAGALILLCYGWKPAKLNRMFYVFAGCVVVSAVLSPFPEIAWFGMPNYLEGAVALLAYCVLALSASDVAMDPEALVNPLAWSTVAMFVACFAQYWNPEWFLKGTHFLIFGNQPQYQMSMETWPLFGTLMNQNLLGTFCAIVYPIFLARRRWFPCLLAVLMAVGSQSRGAWFAMVIATLYLVCKYRTWRLAVPLGFFVLGVALVYLHPTHGGMKWSLASSGRVYVWKKTAEILHPHHLLYGDGPGAFALEFDQTDAKGKLAQGWQPATVVDRPHNFYLQTLHATGLLSLLGLLIFFAGFLLESKEVAINAAVLSYLVNVLFTDSCTSVAPLFWIILGTGVGRLKILKKEKS